MQVFETLGSAFWEALGLRFGDLGWGFGFKFWGFRVEVFKVPG